MRWLKSSALALVLVWGLATAEEASAPPTGELAAAIAETPVAADVLTSPSSCRVSKPVTALTVHRNQLIAAHLEFAVGTCGPSTVWSWSDTSWNQIGFADFLIIHCLTVHDGVVVAGVTGFGENGNSAYLVVKWTGDSWETLASDLKSPVSAICSFEGKLICAGHFRTIGGVQTNGIARWDGTEWHPIGLGFAGCFNALAVYDGRLIAGGHEVGADHGGAISHGVSINRDITVNTERSGMVAAWNGYIWERIETCPFSTVAALTVFNNELVVGGTIETDRETKTCIGSWDGTTWRLLGKSMGGDIFCLAVYGNDLLAGGAFIGRYCKRCSYLSRWDGLEWTHLEY